ncbi:MAG: S-layer homology domain-containing protein [Clostridiales bacterium]|nr:S-layer homology domain-containing protein [Clostridiales bacterium]
MRRYLKVFTVLLALVMFGGIFAILPVSASDKKFSDVTLSPSSDGYKAIYWAVDKGVTTGIKNTDKFAPEDACTRSQAVTFIWRLAGKPSPKTGKSSFSDIDSKFKKDRPEMYKAILWATEKKIVAGYSDGTFRPNTKCSRAHIVTFLYRYAGKPDFKNYSAKKSPFTDVKTSIGKDMYPAILWAKDKGITTGISGTKKFDPKGTCTRKQIVTFLWRYDGKSASKPTATPTATATPSPVPNGKDTTPYKKVTLDGVADHFLVTTDYCYLESDKYVLLLDKDVRIPGDFKINLDAIIDELEDFLQLEYAPKDFEYGNVPDNSVYYDGFNPWNDWYLGTKIPIFIVSDRTDAGRIPIASDNFVVLVSYYLLPDDLWNSVPSYRDNEWRRGTYYDYSEAVHELTHTITMRHTKLTNILCEGIAEYTPDPVIDRLAGKYPSLAKVKENRYPWDYKVPESVDSQNAERIFLEDYRGCEGDYDCAHYVYGEYLCKYISEKNGTGFFKKFVDKAKANNLYINTYYDDPEAVKKYADTLKQVFGKDLFTKFGAWCVEKNVLQKVD